MFRLCTLLFTQRTSVYTVVLVLFLSAINYAFQCVTIFFLLSYITDIQDCQSGPCENDGVCLDGLNGFVCFCTQGYAGDTCNRGKYLFNFLPARTIMQYGSSVLCLPSKQVSTVYTVVLVYLQDQMQWNRVDCRGSCTVCVNL